nr:MAG TPA: hypothetical protein [Caudoviricetes sp.]DAX72748.1 MAG TPA: hypothetical protein [Caudoviricetes sp.]
MLSLLFRLNLRCYSLETMETIHLSFQKLKRFLKNN